MDYRNHQTKCSAPATRPTVGTTACELLKTLQDIERNAYMLFERIDGPKPGQTEKIPEPENSLISVVGQCLGAAHSIRDTLDRISEAIGAAS